MEAVTEYEAFIKDQIITQTESWRKSYEERQIISYATLQRINGYGKHGFHSTGYGRCYEGCYTWRRSFR